MNLSASTAQRLACGPCCCPHRPGAAAAPARSGVLLHDARRRSETSSQAPEGETEAERALREIKLPKTGYLSIADPTQEIYSKATERFDPTKRGGRFKSDFIWNTNWQETLKRDEQLDRQRKEFLEAQEAGTLPGDDTGRMNFGLIADLNDMSVDLSEQLRKKKAQPPPAPAKQQTKPARAASGAAVEPMSRLNAEKLRRMNRGAKTAPTATIASSKTEDEVERERLIAAERVKYERQKQDFQIYTLALTAVGAVTTYTSYSQDVSASYIVGALGGYFYLRLLGKSVDAVGEQSVEGSVGGIAAQPRLLIPIILGLGYNRFNVLYSEQLGVTLQLLPMMAGFFTYKLAVIARESKELLFAPPEPNK